MPDPTTVVKTKRPFGDSLLAEAAGLRWLAAAGPGSARTVTVIDARPDRLALERLVPVAPTEAMAAQFGGALAMTHAAGAPDFGSPPEGWAGDGFIGRQRMTMRPDSRWGRFYAEQRLLPYAHAAREVGTMSRSAVAVIEDLAERLTVGDFDDDRPPARIHGDLWAGNVVWTREGAVVIDPAAHGGHGLTDLAMLALFGSPSWTVTAREYAEAARLPSGWEGLVELHQLHPLLVHAVTHGPSYAAEAVRVAQRYL